MEVSRTIFSKFILIGTLLAGGLAAGQTATPTPATAVMYMVGSPSGMSGYVAGTAANGTVAATIPTIFGGYMGDIGECVAGTRSSTSTCNSCDGTAGSSGNPRWCNQTSIHKDLILSVTLQSPTTATFQGTPRIYYHVSGGGITAGSYAPDNATQPSLALNQPFTIEIKWGNLCSNISGSADCLTSFSGVTLSVGIDNNNDGTLEEKVDFTLVLRSLSVDAATSAAVTNCPANATITDTTQGICDYSVKPGDEKVYLSDYAASNYDLSTSDSNVKYDRIALFYQLDVANAQAVKNNSDNVMLSLKSNSPEAPSVLDLGRIRGLQNDHKYCFALANVDQTGNIMYFPDQTILGTDTKVCATPSEVVGLLDDKHCFIATATYGSMMAPEVQAFREFRNKYLLSNPVGKSIVKAYYKFGPEASEWISHSEALRAASVTGLWPVLLFVKLSLLIGLIPATFVALLGTALIAKFTLWALRHRQTVKGVA